MAEQTENNTNESNRKHTYNDKFVQKIQDVARNGVGLPNGLCKELTYQQALSIFLRSRQLRKESLSYHSSNNTYEKNKQIDECYRQRDRQI